MNCFPPDIRNKLAALGKDDLAESIELIHTRLLKARQPMVRVDHAKTEMELHIGHCFVIWQASLHRCERLMVSCGSAIANDDAYGLAILIRAFLESTVVLTLVRSRLEGVAVGEIDYETFGAAITNTLIGTRIPLSEDQPLATNIMSHMRKADSFISKTLLDNEEAGLSAMYADLSEYAHPNLASNMIAFEIKEEGVYRFQHGKGLSDRHIGLIRILNNSAIIFEKISASFQSLLSQSEWVTPGNVVQFH